MRIVVTGQADLRLLADLIDDHERLPIGTGGVPPIHEIRMLRERGHEVTLVTLDPTITDEVVVRGDRLTVHVGPLRPTHAIRDLYRAERNYLTRTIDSIEADVVHAHWTYEYALAALDSRHPVLVTMHDAALWYLWWNLPHHGSGTVGGRLVRTGHWVLRASMAWRVARRSRFNIAVSPHTRDHFIRILRCRGEVEVIPNLMDPDLWRTAVERDPHTRDTASGPLRCVAVLGTWGDIKNGSTLLEAFALVRRAGVDAQLSMIGSDYRPDGPAAQWARRHHLDDGVEFVGPRTNLEVASTLASADLLVHPSREESCAMVVAEAQLASTAVIGGAASGGIPWSLDYGEAGMLVDIDSPDDLSRAILSLARDPQRRTQLAGAGRAFALERYEPRAIIGRIEGALQRCIAGRRSAPTRGAGT